MKTLIKFLCILFSSVVIAQGNYEDGMNKAFELWQNEKTDAAANLFERIASAEKDNWVPHYYVAQINILKSWDTKDEVVLKAQLDKAQEHLDKSDVPIRRQCRTDDPSGADLYQLDRL